MLFIDYKVGVFVYFRGLACRMAVFEGSSCVKVVTVCRDCGRNIKRSRCSEDNLCDDCEDMVIGPGVIGLCDSKKEYFHVNEINILSGLLRDRKNKFLFVGEGNFSFTVAFNAYRQSLFSMDCSLLSLKNCPRSEIMCILLSVFQITYSITDESVSWLLRRRLYRCKFNESVVEGLKEMYLEPIYVGLKGNHVKQ